MNTLIRLLMAVLVSLSITPAWASRGFDATDGVGSTDALTTTYATNSTLTSWAFWVYRTGDSVSGNGRIFQRDAAGIRLFYEDSAASKYQFEVQWSGGDAIWTTPRPSAGAWHHVLVTYDAGLLANAPIMYIDGASVTVTTFQAPTGTLVTGATAYTIGNTSGGIRVWNGRLAEFAVWEGSILTAGNATSLWNAGAGARADTIGSPTVYWILCGNASPEPNVIGGGSTAVVTGTKKQAHPFVNCPVSTGGSRMLLGVGN